LRARSEALQPPNGVSLVDMTADLHDIEDTAALVSSLDLIITVDIAVAHLAAPWLNLSGCYRGTRAVGAGSTIARKSMVSNRARLQMVAPSPASRFAIGSGREFHGPL
jgi:hypothetical protein